jgi:ABC-type multidrug transport system ATPase subunit
MRLEVRAARKRLNRRLVLDDVDLCVEGAGAVALVGPNGAGKSTLLRTIAGVLAPDCGDVLIDGASLLRDPRLRRHLGFVPEAADPLPHLAVAELLALVAALRRAPSPPGALLERLGVSELLPRRLGTLSLGQRRRACLALALVGEPWLLLLDEPTNGLSADGIAELAAVLEGHHAAGRATLFATHDAGFADRLGARRVWLDAGRVVG